MTVISPRARPTPRAPRRGILALPLLIAAAVLLPTTSHAAPTADAVRLNEGLPPGFRRPKVVLYPLLDQRLLAVETQKDGVAVAPGVPEAWTVFLDELRAARNLAVQFPGLTVRSITDDPGYRRALELAVSTAERGYRDYREVRLEAAAETLEAAVDAFVELEHHVVAPREVARAALTRGLALLENGRPVLAAQAFRRALTLDPGLRLRPGYDLPQAIEAFESAREALVAAGMPAPDAFSARTPLPARLTRSYTLRARMLPDRLEVTIRTASGISVEVQPIGDDARDAGSRLASRVIACLPFGRAPRADGHRSQLFLEAGFDAYAFMRNPVDRFPNVGVAVHLSWLAARRLGLDLHASVANGERDPQEHLRNDIATVRISLAPGFQWHDDRFRASAHVGVEVSTLSQVEITTNPACKFFDPEDSVPSVLCDHDTDIDMFGRAWLVGPMVSLGGSVRLVDEIYLSMRLSGSYSLVEVEDNGFGLPVGGSLALGYRLF